MASNREELFDLMNEAAGTGPIGVVINRMLDALVDNKLAVVPEEATEEMLNAYRNLPRDPELTAWSQTYVRLNAAIPAGNLLKDEVPETERVTLVDGSSVTDDHREIDPTTGMQKAYVVLSDEERAKGFVRPVRTQYRHVGQSVCGKLVGDPDLNLGGPRSICTMKPDHEDECIITRTVTQPEHARAMSEHTLGGCNAITTMARALAETYARDPKFYSGTYCAVCRGHFHVGPEGEFIWEGTDERVGT